MSRIRSLPSAGAVEYPQLRRYNVCMNKPLKLIPIGNSTGVIIPKGMLQQLGVEEGDTLFPVRTPNGIELRRVDPEFADQMRVAREIMGKDRAILRELAK
jgi:putative addiction module antidote